MFGCRRGIRGFAEDVAGHRVLAQRHGGVRAIAIRDIVGSVDRAHSLRADFLPAYPAGRRLDGRHLSIMTAIEAGVPLPPITVYELLGKYYVLDGHHRVAVAQRSGQLDIDAVVTEFHPTVQTGEPASPTCPIPAPRRAWRVPLLWGRATA